MSTRLVVTPGEPVGIGPELLIQLAAQGQLPPCVVVTDPELLRARAAQIRLPAAIHALDQADAPLVDGAINVLPCPLDAPVVAGRVDPANARCVLRSLDLALEALRTGACAALCTGPVHKGVINDAGMPFTGHTEYLAEPFADALPVMLLAGPSLRVALVTTHLPLRDVPAAITTERVLRCLRLVDQDLKARFGCDAPRIRVTGLNPHAGEGGHLGHEDEAVIRPAIEAARAAGIRASGPWPGDTCFEPHARQQTDAFLAMFHDQGLAVVKALDFGQVVNVTLGLPIIRTSVDHGTALDLAGTGRGDASSLLAALHMAQAMARAASPDIRA